MDEKINKIQTLLNSWIQRQLTLQGRATVLNILIASRLWYSFTVLPVPHWVEVAFSKMFSKFLWVNKKPKIAAVTCMGKCTEGGLNIPNLCLKKYALRLKLLKAFLDYKLDSLWKATMSFFFSKYLNMGLQSNILCLKFDKKDMLHVNPFYAELLLAWEDICGGKRSKPTTLPDIMCQPLFNNPLILYMNKTLLFKSFIDGGITCIKDICYEVIPQFLSPDSIVEIVQGTIPDVDVATIKNGYAVILYALPTDWKQIILSDAVINLPCKEILCPIANEDVSVQLFTVKYCYEIFRTKYFKKPVAMNWWNNISLDINWKDVWVNVYQNDKSAECIQLDFKIAHNIIYTYDRLSQFGLTDTDICPVCQNEKEDVLHLFIFCKELSFLQSLFVDILTDVCQDTGFTLGQFSLWLLFGFLPERSVSAKPLLDILLSIYRLAVFKRRVVISLGTVSFHINTFFKSLVKRHLTFLLYHYTKKKRLHVFIQKYIMSNDLIELDGNDILLKHPLD